MSRLRLAGKCYCDELGWRIIPVINKRPLPGLTWKRPPDFTAIAHLFDDPRVTGLAVVLGQVSGNLAVRDFDSVSGYEIWAAQYPELASTLPTVVTSRGRHVYARTEVPCKTTHFEDGELRGEGAYVVVPPSRHETGHVYRWEIFPFGGIPTVDPAMLVGTTNPKSQNVSPKSSRVRKAAPPSQTHAIQTNTLHV
jgi:Bifunctional DNA primase/polymerase, N-terminal